LDIDQATDDATIDRIEWEDPARSGASTAVGTGEAVVRGVALYLQDIPQKVAVLKGGESLSLFVQIEALGEIARPSCGWILYNSNGLYALHTNTDIAECQFAPLRAGDRVRVEFRFRMPPLRNGDYIFSVSISDGDQMLHRVQDIWPIRIAREGALAVQFGYIILEEASADVRRLS
jgi:hypothetical protein